MSERLKIWIRYVIVIIVTIAVGLVSRKVAFIPECVGDALWAVVVYCCWRIVLVKRAPRIAAAAALVTSFAVEFSQMIRWEWLVRFRSTLIGHLLLGQGFTPIDLIAYTVGIGAALVCTLFIGKKTQSNKK